jgi:imidazoleglycerol phosphate synthase glutamine amidotransferase subunit HisH
LYSLPHPYKHGKISGSSGGVTLRIEGTGEETAEAREGSSGIDRLCPCELYNVSGISLGAGTLLLTSREFDSLLSFDAEQQRSNGDAKVPRMGWQRNQQLAVRTRVANASSY